MRIALLTAHLNSKCGYGNFAYEFCCALKKSGIDFILYAPKSEQQYLSDYSRFQVKCVLPEFVFSFKNKEALKYIALPPAPEIQNYQLVHSLFAFPYCLLAARWAKKYKKPLIIGTQGTFALAPLLHFPEKFFLRWAYNQANTIISPSHFTKEKIQKFSKTKTPIRIIHNGVNFQKFRISHDTTNLIRSKYGEKIILLTVGALKRRKGQDLVIQALAKARQDFHNFHYLIIGSGATEPDLKKMVSDLKLENKVSFLGTVPDDKLVQYFQLCDIYIHPARNVNWHIEGFGMVYLEAGACKKPVIAADSGGVPDAVIANKTGLMVPENDVTVLAQSIVKLCKDSKLRNKLGQNNFEYAKKHDWSQITDKFIDLYKSVI